MKKSFCSLGLLFLLLFVSKLAEANPGGISGFSGQSTSCIACHSGGLAPSMTLTGPISMAAGQTGTFLFKIRGGQKVNVGLDVSATAGDFLVTDTSNTQILNHEITHAHPAAVDANGEYSFRFSYTAPTILGAVTLYAAGLSTNGGGSSGSGQGLLSMNITVNPAPPCMTPVPDPGPQPADPGVQPPETIAYCPNGPRPSYSPCYWMIRTNMARVNSGLKPLPPSSFAGVPTVPNPAHASWVAVNNIYQTWVTANAAYQAWLAGKDTCAPMVYGTVEFTPPPLPPPKACTPAPGH